MTSFLWLSSFFASSPSVACDGKKDAAHAADESCATDHAKAAQADPSHCAGKAELVGPEACSWTTAMVAQRVLEEGTPWTYVGRLTASTNALPSKVAAPYTVGPDQKVHVVANEVLETLEAPTARRVELTGRLLEVDGITYFVVTAITPSST